MNRPPFQFSAVFRALACACLLAIVPALGGCDDVSTFLAGESSSMSLANATWSGDRSTATAAGFVTARTQQEWTRIWATVGKPAPVTLPEGKMAVAIFLGEQLHGNPQLEILTAEVVHPPGGIERATVTYRVATQAAVAAAEAGLAPISPWAVRIMDRSVTEPSFQQVD